MPPKCGSGTRAWKDENPWPRLHFKNDVRAAAESLTRDSKAFLLAQVAGKRPAVPDSVWHGSDCWVLETGGTGWRVNPFARQVAAYLAKQQK